MKQKFCKHCHRAEGEHHSETGQCPEDAEYWKDTDFETNDPDMVTVIIKEHGDRQVGMDEIYHELNLDITVDDFDRDMGLKEKVDFLHDIREVFLKYGFGQCGLTAMYDHQDRAEYKQSAEDFTESEIEDALQMCDSDE